MAQPESLVKLSLEAIGKYFCDLWYDFLAHFNAIIRNYRSEEEEKKEQALSLHVQKLKCTCRNFHRLLTDNVPVNLANDVTNKLLSCIDSFDIRYASNELEELIKCAIHPAVSRIAPKLDFLDCSDIFPKNEFDTMVLVELLVKNISCLTNLKSLSLGHSLEERDLSETDIEFPSFLEEISGFCGDKTLKEIAKSCRFIKALNLCGLSDITDSSVATILQMENLQKLNIVETSITNQGHMDLLKGLIEKGETSKLKYLILSICNGNILKILQALPSLKLGIHCNYLPLHHVRDEEVELSSLKNLHSLHINTTLTGLNKIIKGIDRHLVYLEVFIDTFHDINNVIVEAVLLIGQCCTSLQCLHLSCIVDRFLSLEDYMRHPPVFQTITCLNLKVGSTEISLHDAPYERFYPHKDFLYFMISQCVNVKKLEIIGDLCSLNKYEFICNVIQAEYIKYVEEIYFKNHCLKPSDNSRDNEVVQKLVDHCPKLRTVGGIHFNESHKHNSQKLKFIREPVKEYWL